MVTAWRTVPESSWPDYTEPLRLPDGEVHVWLASLDQPDSVLGILRQSLTATEQARVDRYVRAVSRQQATVSRGVLRHLLSAYTGIPAGQVRLGEGPHQKPLLCDGQAAVPLMFNVSHSGARLLIAVICHREIGVDIESFSRFTDMAGVAKRSFSRREFAIWAAADPADQAAVFFHFWSHKESVIKACGRGLLVPLDSFETPAEPSDHPTPVYLSVPDSDETNWFVRVLDPCPGYAAAVCMAGAALPVTMYQVTASFFERLPRAFV